LLLKSCHERHGVSKKKGTVQRSSFLYEQITYALRQAERAPAVADVCRQLGIIDATFCVWKKKYANLGAAELRLLRDENAKLIRLVADLTLDKHILGEIVGKTLRPARKRELVKWVREACGANLLRAYRLAQISRTLKAYCSKKPPQEGLCHDGYASSLRRARDLVTEACTCS
jgi:putative transposase